MHTALHLLSQPNLYTTLVALFFGFYIVWVLARQQYLGVFAHFDLVVLTASGVIVGALVGQLVFPGYLEIPSSLEQIAAAWRQPFSIFTLLFGYVLAGAAGWLYIRHIRYPFWRTMDSTVVGLSLVELGWLIGLLIAQPTIPVAITTAAIAIVFLVLLIIQQRFARPGVATSLHILLIFAICLGLRVTLVSWQGESSIVEYVSGGIGVITGALFAVIRMRWKVSPVTLNQLPVGVSQKFRETFNRAKIVKQPSQTDGSR